MTNRRGFTSTIAIGLLILVSALLGLIAALSRFDSQRTGREVSEVQMRQLLLAGTKEARRSLSEPGGLPQLVALPEELKSAGGGLEIIRREMNEGQANFEVRAYLGEVAASQNIQFERVDGAWTLKNVGQN